MNPTIELAKVAVNVGTFGLNVLMIVLAYKLIKRFGPGFIETTKEFSAALATLAAKIDTLINLFRPTKTRRTNPQKGKR